MNPRRIFTSSSTRLAAAATIDRVVHIRPSLDVPATVARTSTATRASKEDNYSRTSKQENQQDKDKQDKDQTEYEEQRSRQDKDNKEAKLWVVMTRVPLSMT